MMNPGYDKTSYDHCVLAKKFSNGIFIILLLYVDDMLIVGHEKNEIQSFKRVKQVLCNEGFRSYKTNHLHENCS